MKKKFDLTWGESVCVRKAFVDVMPNDGVMFGNAAYMDMGYPKHEGDEKLVEITRKIIERQTGLKPKHVLLTNGATGAVVIALRAFFHHSFKYCLTDEPPYFPLYPDMINNSGLIHLNQDYARAGDAGKVFLLDSPSNPTGKVMGLTKAANSEVSVVWDAVYHNRVYMPSLVPAPDHDVMCGSYSKLTGLNGIRVGWIATNHDALADTIGKIVTAEYIGLSSASTVLLLSQLEHNFDWEAFEKKAKENILRNKAEWGKVIKYLGDEQLPLTGMFHYAPIDTSAKYLLEKAGVSYMKGSKCGALDTHGRFNLGQDNDLVRDAVKSILKADVIFKL